MVAVNDFNKFNNAFLKSSGIGKDNIILCDNTKKNIPLPRRYNDAIINSLEQKGPEWFVLCHQDFYFGEDISLKLKELDRHYIYGPIGLNSQGILIGRILHGEDTPVGEPLGQDDLVETLDCMCIIVNKETIIERNLLFDESFRFHMYAEDFSYSARSKGILAKVLQMNAHHRCKTNTQYLDDPEYTTARARAVMKWGLIRTTTGIWSVPYKPLNPAKDDIFIEFGRR